MFKVTSDGDVSFVSKSLRIFSDSSEREFLIFFRVIESCDVLFNLRDKGVFVSDRYCALEFNVKFLQDFFVNFNIGDFYVEIANTAHHEEN